MLGWLQFLILLGVFIVYGITRWFEAPTMWVFALPLSFRVIAQTLDTVGRSSATRKHFEYQYKPDVASWLEGDVRSTYPPNRETKASSPASTVG